VKSYSQLRPVVTDGNSCDVAIKGNVIFCVATLPSIKRQIKVNGRSEVEVSNLLIRQLDDVNIATA
jgi:hypothetical protein